MFDIAYSSSPAASRASSHVMNTRRRWTLPVHDLDYLCNLAGDVNPALGAMNGQLDAGSPLSHPALSHRRARTSCRPITLT